MSNAVIVFTFLAVFAAIGGALYIQSNSPEQAQLTLTDRLKQISIFPAYVFLLALGSHIVPGRSHKGIPAADGKIYTFKVRSHLFACKLTM